MHLHDNIRADYFVYAIYAQYIICTYKKISLSQG